MVTGFKWWYRTGDIWWCIYDMNEDCEEVELYGNYG